MGGELFRMEGISKSFPGVKALQDVSFSVNKGEIHALVGENGAGKSTLMKVMSGVYQADEGDIYIENELVKIPNISAGQELGISIIFQELNLTPHLSVADNIFIGRPPKIGPFINDKEMHRQAQIILDNLGIDINTHTVVRDLSVAQQQMVEIAKAISFDSKILVLDEPTAALSENEIQNLFTIIRNLQSKGVGMVYISHRMEELDQICGRVTILRDGEYIGTYQYADLTTDKLVQLIVGRKLEDKYPKYQRVIGDVIFRGENIRRGKAVNVEEIQVHSGEILGIAGLMGAGRTEIMRLLFGADKADSKTLYMYGNEITVNSPEQAIKHGIAYATEDRKFDGLCIDLDVNYNVNIAHLRELSKGLFLDDAQGRVNTEEYIEKLRIRTPSSRQTVRNLSGGNQQKIILAKWLLTNAHLLIVDEPTRGIDVGAKYEIYELFNQLSDQGVAIIMISSELPEILGMSDRVLVVHDGSINGELNAKETTQEEILYLAAGYNLAEQNRERRCDSAEEKPENLN